MLDLGDQKFVSRMKKKRKSYLLFFSFVSRAKRGKKFLKIIYLDKEKDLC
jgi:hypothetical protein